MGTGTGRAVRGAAGGGALLLAALAAGSAVAGAAEPLSAPAAALPAVDAAPRGAAPPLRDPAPLAPARGVPLERLPDSASAGSRTAAGVPTGPGGAAPDRSRAVPASAVWLATGAGAVGVLVLRQRRLAEGPQGERSPDIGDLATGTPALASALALALVEAGETGEPVGLVLLRLDAHVPRSATPPSRAQEWAAADAVLEALDTAVPLVARHVGLRSREGDGLVRLGVNRLAVVLPGSGSADVRAVGERLRAAVAAEVAPGLAVHVGSASSPGDGALPGALLRAAERSLTRRAARAAV